MNLKFTNPDDFSRFKDAVYGDHISIPDAWELIKGAKRKIHQTKFWKEKRKSFIGDKCVNCFSSEKLTLQHTKQPVSPKWKDVYADAKYNKNEASKLQLLGYIASFMEYLDFVHTKTLCNKCAYAEDFKGSTRMLCDNHNTWYYSAYGCQDCNNEAYDQRVISIKKVDELLDKTHHLDDDQLIKTAQSLEGDQRFWYVIKMHKYHKRIIEPFKHFFNL